jgi:aminoglycoside phosphotransferase (APT) family kinase protein
LSDFVQQHTAEWLEYFGRRGYPDVRPLGAGVEGAIYRLGDGTVAKVWARRGVSELVRMQKFYADVAAGGLPFDTPVILGVEEIDASAVTFERELFGKPLQEGLSTTADGIDHRSATAVIGILRALAEVPATAAMTALPVLGEQDPFWSDGSFTEALSALLVRRVDRFGSLISSKVEGFDQLFARVLEMLQGLAPVPSALIHGDLFGENILVDEAGDPSAVLDFGFISTAGDPRFDAAVTAMIMDMYGPYASAATQALIARIVEELGYPIEVLILYQAAYAIATSNFFTSDGSDGHFPWCMAQLNRADVRDVLKVR